MTGSLRAGFGKADLTPPLGVRMSGFGHRDRAKGCESILDPLFARVLVLEQGGRRVVLAAFDLLFFERPLADRLAGILSRVTGAPRAAVLLNCSHTHAGPCVDGWGYNGFLPPETAYMEQVAAATEAAAGAAVAALRPARLKAGAGRTTLPVSRRKPDGKGGVAWRPYPEGEVCTHVPVLWVEGQDGRPLCLAYSAACHPSTITGWAISADFPGAAGAILEARYGAPTLFLQGAGGDTKARSIADGRDDVDGCWRRGTAADVAAAGRLLAADVAAAVERGLTARAADLSAARVEIEAPLRTPLPDRPALEAVRTDPAADELRRLWAGRQLAALDSGRALAPSARIMLQVLSIADGVRVAAVEGELVGELGNRIRARLGGDASFALGYSNGTGLYLPNRRMIGEGGYEAESYYEYGLPAPLAAGWETALEQGLDRLAAAGSN